MQRVEIGDAVDAEHDRFAIEFEDAYHDVLEPSGLRDQSRISNVAFEDAYHDLLEPSGLRNLSLTSGNGGNAQNLALGHGNTRAQTVQHAPAPAAHSYSGHASKRDLQGPADTSVCFNIAERRSVLCFRAKPTSRASTFPGASPTDVQVALS